jgi:hypothetical protein
MHSIHASLCLAALLTASVAGCSGDSPAQLHSFVDSSGRSCTVDLNDVSGTATCNINASTIVMCAAGTDPVFATNDSYDSMTHIWSMQNCGGCINRAMHTTLISSPTCANITCMSNADCFESSFTCMSGSCRHM